MAKLDGEVLPFASQAIGAIFRLMGWGYNLHADAEFKEARNSAVQAKLLEIFNTLKTTPVKKQITCAEAGRLRIEESGPGAVKIYILLGDLKVHP